MLNLKMCVKCKENKNSYYNVKIFNFHSVQSIIVSPIPNTFSFSYFAVWCFFPSMILSILTNCMTQQLLSKKGKSKSCSIWDTSFWTVAHARKALSSLSFIQYMSLQYMIPCSWGFLCQKWFDVGSKEPLSEDASFQYYVWYHITTILSM